MNKAILILLFFNYMYYCAVSQKDVEIAKRCHLYGKIIGRDIGNIVLLYPTP